MHVLKFRKLCRDPAAFRRGCDRQNACQIAYKIDGQFFTFNIGRQNHLVDHGPEVLGGFCPPLRGVERRHQLRDLLLVAGAHIGVEDDLFFRLRREKCFQFLQPIIDENRSVFQHLRWHAVTDRLDDLVFLPCQLALSRLIRSRASETTRSNLPVGAALSSAWMPGRKRFSPEIA
nr:hypothetical protein [Phaeobacter inhibens]